MFTFLTSTLQYLNFKLKGETYKLSSELYIIAPAEVSNTFAVFNAHFYYKQYLRSRHTSSGLYIVAPVALSNT